MPGTVIFRQENIDIKLLQKVRVDFRPLLISLIIMHHSYYNKRNQKLQVLILITFLYLSEPVTVQR